MSNSNRTIYSPVFLPCWIINQCIWELGVSLFFMYDSSLIMYVKMPQTLDWSMYRILFFSYTWRVCLSFLLRVWLRKFWFCVIVCFGLEYFNVSMVDLFIILIQKNSYLIWLNKLCMLLNKSDIPLLFHPHCWLEHQCSFQFDLFVRSSKHLHGH